MVNDLGLTNHKGGTNPARRRNERGNAYDGRGFADRGIACGTSGYGLGLQTELIAN